MELHRENNGQLEIDGRTSEPATGMSLLDGGCWTDVIHFKIESTKKTRKRNRIFLCMYMYVRCPVTYEPHIICSRLHPR